MLNAANEVAVDAFLNGVMPFMEIPRVIEDVLCRTTISSAETLNDILAADSIARAAAQERIACFPLQHTAVN